VIAAVEEQPIRNKWKMETSLEDVLVFDDGKQLVLSHSTRLELIGRFGSESDDWIGKSISLGTRAAERKGRVIWERFLFPADATPQGVEQDDEPIEFPDEAEVDRSAFRFGRRR